MDINQVIQESIKEINFEEIARQAAMEKIQESVKKSVEEQFRSYSDFGEKLKNHLKNELSIDFGAIKLPEYREFLVGAVNNSLASFTTGDHAKEISDHINKMVVGESRDEIECSKFWDELTEMINDSCDEDDYEKYIVELCHDQKSYGSDYYKLTISEKKDSYSYSSRDRSEVIYAAFSDGVIYHMRSNDDWELSNVFTWLKALKFRKTKILDFSDEEMTLPIRDY